MIALQKQSEFPYNCVGCVSGMNVRGTGTLINSRFVLTAASNLLSMNKTTRKMEINSFDYFGLEVQADFMTFNRQIKISDFRYP